MNLRSIRYLLAVAKVRNFSQAAKILNIAQSAVTTQIKQLEDEVGFQLLHRTTRQVSLTSEGIFLIPKLEEWLEQLASHIQEARDHHLHYDTRLNIGFLASATSSFLPEIIRKFTAKFSNVNIRLFEGNPNEQRFKLESGDLDLAFTRSLKMSPNFKKITLLQDELMIARPLTFRSKQNAEQPKTDNHVESIYIISPEVAEETYFASIQQLRRIELKISRVVTVKDYHSAIISVEAGLGIALLPSCIEKIFKHRLSFIPISHPEKVDLDLVYRPDKKKAIRDFVRFVSSELKSII